MDRKYDHIKFALEQEKEYNSFDEYRLKYYSIPSFSLNSISTKTKLGNIELEFPFFINAITAGNEKSDKINKDLEYVAKKTNIFFFPGSYSPFLKKEENNYPKGLGLNLGADKDFKLHLKAISDTKAKILQIHVNMIQEMLMPEGDKNFENWEINIRNVVKNTNIPVILKETGFGMNEETIKKAIDLGIKIIDISGKNGTNFAKIENKRRNLPKDFYNNIGYSTTKSIIAATKFSDKITIVASGGIRNPLDIIKALALGADAVGISRTFLEVLEKKGREALINMINEWKEDIKNLMLLSNSKNILELRNKVFKKEC